MAFCSGCGGQLEGNERFCAKCGADQTAMAGGTPPVQAPPPQAPPAQAAFPPQPAQPYPAMPPQYPPQLSAAGTDSRDGHAAGCSRKEQQVDLDPNYRCRGLVWSLLIGTHDQQQNPAPAPAPQTQPGTPTPQAQPGAPTPQAQPGAPTPQAPPTTPTPQAQPGAPGQGGNNQALVAQQQLTCRWKAQNGSIEITQAQWKNGSAVTIQTAIMETQQVSAAGQIIAQNQSTLNGPVQPGQTVTLSSISMGATAQGVTQVNCGIVGVTPAN